MKYCFKIILFLLLPALTNAQINAVSETTQQVDSLLSVSRQTDNDSLKMEIYDNMTNYYGERNRDSAIYYAEQELAIAKKIKQPIWQGDALNVISYEWMHLGNYSQSLQAANDALKLAENKASEINFYYSKMNKFYPDPHKNRLALLSLVYVKFAFLYENTGNDDKAIANLVQASRIAESIDNPYLSSLCNMHLGEEYLSIGKLDSALVFLQKAIAYSNASNSKIWLGDIYVDIGHIYLKQKNYDSALNYFQQSLKVNREQNNLAGEGYAYQSLAGLFLTIHQPDSTIDYGHKALEIYQLLNDQNDISSVYSDISAAYKMKRNTDSAFAYLELSKHLGDSLTRVDKAQTNKYQALNFAEQLRLENIEKEKIQLQARIRTYAMLAGIVVFMLIAFLLYRNNRNRKKANDLLQHKNVEIEQQKQNVEQTLTELKSTQAQLIQSEKMASLGELTAGIAHEIQNPLNFVNNFSEVNKELLIELKDEMDKGNMDDAKAIANDVIDNEEKINHHGKRADAIVKGMLQHTRASSGKKEPTDINALADEYLRLAYHGLRAKDKSFNATMKTDYYESIGKINIVPQDIGRVILNLLTNAFYAAPLPPEGGFKDPNYKHEPTVWVSTKKVGDKVLISVRDNGPGIPQKVVDKIFQPFFTTKPTGQGTGLGLSLSYDIIKAHGGEIKVETKEGEGSEFLISLTV